MDTFSNNPLIIILASFAIFLVCFCVCLRFSKKKARHANINSVPSIRVTRNYNYAPHHYSDGYIEPASTYFGVVEEPLNNSLLSYNSHKMCDCNAECDCVILDREIKCHFADTESGLCDDWRKYSEDRRNSGGLGESWGGVDNGEGDDSGRGDSGGGVGNGGRADSGGGEDYGGGGDSGAGVDGGGWDDSGAGGDCGGGDDSGGMD